MPEDGDLLQEGFTFPPKLINAAIGEHLDSQGVKIGPSATKLLAEVCRVVVVEAAARAALEARQEGEQLVQLPHLEKILAQLLLDL
ncbi:Centromere protein X [Trinorchestia longiramus]|nr:Centromere protein X [Trinorchestia longiramus]KAF2355108.1 Centromere protein X [Trinorchestia longiramus]